MHVQSNSLSGYAGSLKSTTLVVAISVYLRQHFFPQDEEGACGRHFKSEDDVIAAVDSRLEKEWTHVLHNHWGKCVNVGQDDVGK